MQFTFGPNGYPDSTIYELSWKLTRDPVSPAVPWHQTGSGYSWSNGSSMYSLSRTGLQINDGSPNQLGSTGMYSPWYYGLIATTKYLNRVPPISSPELDRLFVDSEAVMDAYANMTLGTGSYSTTTLTHVLSSTPIDEQTDIMINMGSQDWKYYHTTLQTASNMNTVGGMLIGVNRDPGEWSQQILATVAGDSLKGLASRDATALVHQYLRFKDTFDVFTFTPLLDFGGLGEFSQPMGSSNFTMQSFLEQIMSMSVNYQFDPVNPWVWIPFYGEWCPVGSFTYGLLTFGQNSLGTGHLTLDSGQITLAERCRVTTPLDPFEACSLFRNMSTLAPHGKDLLRLWVTSLPSDQWTKPPP